MLTAARLTMSRALSGNPSIFQKAKQEVINRFITHFAHESVIMNLERTDGLAAVKRITERDGIWHVVGLSPCNLQNPASRDCQLSGIEGDAGMPRVGIRCEVPEDTDCVEKRHASPQVHHLQDVASRSKSPSKLEKLKELNEFRELKELKELKEVKFENYAK